MLMTAGNMGDNAGVSLPCVSDVDDYIASSNTTPHLDGHQKAEATVAELDHSYMFLSQVLRDAQTLTCSLPVAPPEESPTSQTLIWALCPQCRRMDG